MAISVTVRPDRVTATGVIAPYPVRQVSPVAVARATVNPFVAGVRGVGPTLSGPNQVATYTNFGPRYRAHNASPWQWIKAKMGWR